MFENITNPYKYAAIGLGAALIIGGAAGAGYVGGIQEGNKKVVAAQVACEKRVAAIKLDLQDAENRAQAASNQVNDRIVTEYVERIRYVDRVRVEYVAQANTLVPTQNELSRGWVYLYDQSATGQPSDPAKVADPTPSGVTDSRALETIVVNNAEATSCRAQLSSLQTWIRDQKAAIGSVNNGAPQ